MTQYIVVNNYATDTSVKELWKSDLMEEGAIQESLTEHEDKTVVEAAAQQYAQERGLQYRGILYPKNAGMRLRG